MCGVRIWEAKGAKSGAKLVNAEVTASLTKGMICGMEAQKHDFWKSYFQNQIEIFIHLGNTQINVVFCVIKSSEWHVKVLKALLLRLMQDFKEEFCQFTVKSSCLNIRV